MAIIASFNPASATLVETGDALDNTIVTSRDAAGNLLVNGGAVAVRGPKPTVANTSLIQASGGGGNDVIALDESNGALPAAHLFGGAGNDILTGGSGADLLFGQSGDDTLFGKGGADALFGGAGNDVLTGGDADDAIYGEAGNDRMIWNPGDDSDLMEGGDGIDTVEVNGGGGAEIFTITANGDRVRFDRLNPAPFALDIGTSEKLVLNAGGGDDSISATGNLAALIQITIDGGAGNDTILGSNGADLLLGGDGNDFIDGQQGNDTVFLGAGDDLFQWDPGDGSDVIEGQDGTDTLLFNGSAANEAFVLSASGGRALFTRNVGNIVMDMDDMERIQLHALGGTDTVTVDDMAGTDVVRVDVNLAGTLGGTSGDGAADTVGVKGTGSADIIDVFGSGTAATVVGLAAMVAVTNAEGANDTLVVSGLGGDDRITATTLPAGVMKLTLDGGAGNDTLLGSQGADTLIGGDGDDMTFGDNGNDLALMGAGNDLFQWDPGDGSDTVEGGDGSDALLFFGSNINENIAIAANGGRALFTRDIGGVTMDLNDLERIEFRALGGGDNIVVGDLSGTDVTQVVLDLRGPNGGGDAAIDTVTVHGTQGIDSILVSGGADGVQVGGLAASTSLLFQEATDRLVVQGLGGNDVIDARGLAAGAVSLTLNGGLGADSFFGSHGDDLVIGGDGDDVALMGAGDDTFTWNPGDDNDIVEGQDGFDTLDFNGANIGEKIDISANGGRVRFTRDVASVVMDTDDVEQFDFQALGGADDIVIRDLSGTDVQRVRIDLGAAGGGSDGQADKVTVEGTAGDDVIYISSSGTTLFVEGLGQLIVIENFDAATDQLVINGLGGDDVVDASGVLAPMGIVAAGGDGDDVLLGGDGNDTLDGGPGDDVLIGGPGQDVLVNGEVQIQ